MLKFDERVFIYSLCSRDEDCKKFAAFFQPDWLDEAENVAILAEVFKFTNKYNATPSIKTLHTVFRNADPILYEGRMKEALTKISDLNVDVSESIYTLDKARDVAITKSISLLYDDAAFKERMSEGDGEEILKSINEWQVVFQGQSDKKTLDMKTAVDNLIKQASFQEESPRIPCGIGPIDRWCGGGLRKKQLGILMAPTGQGKSTLLVIMADKMARVEDKRVWFVTNELSWEETTERFLCRISGVPLTEVINDPTLSLGKLKRQWEVNKLHDKLIISDYFRPPISTNDIESELMRQVSLRGWKPDILILDFMERMKPNQNGINRSNEWVWLQVIGSDLVSLAKRHNLVIWTACQTNRAGLSKDVKSIGLEHGQSSIRHFQEATAVVTFRQVKTGPDKYGMQLFNKKQRQSKNADESVVLECDLSRMHVSDKEVKIIEVERDDDEGEAESPRQKKRRRKK
jgi:hypothetical protein